MKTPAVHRIVPRRVNCDAASRNEPPVPPSSVSLGYLGFTVMAPLRDLFSVTTVLSLSRRLAGWLFEMYSAPDGRRGCRSE